MVWIPECPANLATLENPIQLALIKFQDVEAVVQETERDLPAYRHLHDRVHSCVLPYSILATNPY